jgi:hypothetical protein
MTRRTWGIVGGLFLGYETQYYGLWWPLACVLPWVLLGHWLIPKQGNPR